MSLAGHRKFSKAARIAIDSWPTHNEPTRPVFAYELPQALFHLIGSFIRECDSTYVFRTKAMAIDEMRNTACQNAGLA